MRVRLSAALIAELHYAEVENFELEELTGGQREVWTAIEAIGGQKTATIELSRDGAEYLASALDNIEDIAKDNSMLPLARAARKKRAEIEAMLRGPTMSNPSRTAGSLVGLGTLEALEMLDPATGRTRTMSFAGGKQWLGWDGGKRRFAICHVVREAGAGRLSPAVVKAHRRFHTEAPRTAVVADVPTPTGRLQQLGLVKALIYVVPRRVLSPEKNPHRWHHEFGATRHDSQGPYPQRVMPALMRDARGNFFIKRRPGNIFTVDTWLRG